MDGAQLVFGAGADEILELLAKVLLGPGDECVFAWPSFAMYPIVVQGMGARSVRVPLGADLVHDLPALARAVTPRTKLVFVCNPNNPTGTSVGAEAFDRFAASLPPSLVLAVDEAYVDFARRPDFPDALAWVRRRPGHDRRCAPSRRSAAWPACGSATASPIPSSPATCSARAIPST